uniref:Glycosyltransferase family 92 protein n=1 Tax=Panagrellus redivivus TaxID=6233 RepID=A0A7E4VBJ9_PANRE
MHFEQSHISNDFLKSLSTLTLKPSSLDICNCRCDEDVTFLTILDIFPCITSILVNFAYFGWLNDLSCFGKQFRFILIFYDNFEKIFSFQPEKLYDFVAKQGCEFRLYIRHYNGDNLTDKIEQYIDPRFQHGNFKNANFIVSFEYAGSVNETPYVVNNTSQTNGK